MNTLSIDPGASTKGALAMSFFVESVWARGVVVTLSKDLATACVEARDAARHLVADGHPTHVAMEEMRYRPQRGSAKASSEIAALLRLQAIGAFVSGHLCTGRFILRTVNEWKCSLPKEICHARLRDRVFSADEWTRLSACAKLYGARGHNLLDSAGIGAAALGRFRV